MHEKKDDQSKSWRITDFDTSETRKQFYRDLDKTRMALGNERTEEGLDHLQIFITFRRNYRWNAFKKLIHNGSHFEMAKVDDWNYELKEGNYELEDNRSQGARLDLKKAETLLKQTESMRAVCGVVYNNQAFRTAEIYLKYMETPREIQPKKMDIRWYHGSSGSGKTREVFKEFGTEVFRPISYKWWEGYDGHKCILIDDFRKDWCKFKELLSLLDVYPYRLECKNGSRQIKAYTFIITTPHHWKDVYCTREDLYQLERRITVTKVFGTDQVIEIRTLLIFL